MKYKKVVFFILIVMTLILSTFIKNSDVSTNNTQKDITIRIKQGTLTKSSLVLIIENNSNKNYTYTDEFEIQIMKNKKWSKIECDDCWFNLPIHTIDPKEKTEIICDWKRMYGDLETGTYRIIKKFNNKNIHVIFQI